MSQQEKDNFGHEVFNAEELQESNREHQERLKEGVENKTETRSHEDLENARKEAYNEAGRAEKEQHAETVSERPQSPAERRNGPISKREKDLSFQTTMKETYSQMSAPSRSFSKIIHNPVIEKMSDTVGSTIARPNAILSGSVFAFIFTLAVYLIARLNGYPLTGSETIASFVIGWIIGIIYDFLKTMVTGKK